MPHSFDRSRRRRRPALLRCLLPLSLAVLAGCSSTVTGDGSHSTSPSSTAVSVSVASPSSTPAPTATGSSPAPATPTSAVPSRASAPGPTLCAAATTGNATAQCLRAALADFWSGQLNNTISEPVHLEAPAADVPAACRGGLTGAPAFTCEVDLSLYINRSLLDLIDKFIPSADRVYAFAAVQSHEIGHVLQYTLHQPQIGLANPSNTQRQFVEQQADCLSGVWAHSESRFDRTRFRTVAVRLLTLVSSNAEIATHGTPAQRAAAIDRGLATGRPQSCRLVTFG